MAVAISSFEGVRIPPSILPPKDKKKTKNTKQKGLKP